MKRSHGDAFETRYDQPQQLDQRPCRGLRPTSDEDVLDGLQQQQQQQLRPQQQQSRQVKPGALRSQVRRIVIGDWNRVSVFSEDLIMKCYFAKRKLVWEFLDKTAAPDTEGIKAKRKMEINWSDLFSCKVYIDPKDNTGIFQIQLNKYPTFYIETNQRPRKHTEWKLHQDFTTNRSASSYATHTLYFASGELQKNLEKLLNGDNRFWSTVLHIEHSNNNTFNGSYSLPDPTHGLNENCPNINMETQQVWGNDDGREVVLEPIPLTVLKSSDPLREAEANANSRMMYLPENNMQSLDLEDALNTSNPPGETQPWIAQDPNLQSYWESVYDKLPPLEPIPETVLETSNTTTPQLDVVLETLDFDFEDPFLDECFKD